MNDNSNIYESSTLATVAIGLIPIIWWFMNHGRIFPPDWRVKTFGWAFIFACLLIPVGTRFNGIHRTLTLEDVHLTYHKGDPGGVLLRIAFRDNHFQPIFVTDDEGRILDLGDDLGD